MTSWLSAIPVFELLVRMAATASVVVAVSWAVGAFGPRIGGALAGLPIVLGPGFYFLAQQAPADFAARAATYAVLSLCATQCFLLAYVIAAGRKGPASALGIAFLAWACGALVARQAPGWPLAGAVLFALATLTAWRVGGPFVPAAPRAKGKAGVVLLLVRGGLAGLLVAGVTTAASWLGPADAGLLMAFPIGFTVMALTIHQQMGAAVVAATLHSALLGTVGLAGFCFTLALTLPHWPPLMALAAGMAVSVGVTLLLLTRHRWWPGRRL